MPRLASPTRPDDILNAALTLFDQVGFDAARVDDIAAAAGVSKGGVYLHFKSKTAILEALIARDIAPIAAAAAAMANAGQDDPLATLRLLLKTLPQRLENPRLFAIPRLVISCGNRFPEVTELYRQEVLMRVHGALRSLVAAAMAKGQLRAHDADAVTRMIMGTVFIEVMRRHVFRDETASAAVAIGNLELLLGLLAPERAP